MKPILKEILTIHSTKKSKETWELNNKQGGE